MPRFRQISQILNIMHKKENIRNIGIIAHIDHGKTTLADSLLAGAGLLSPSVAGEARVLDYLEEEQKRGITIKTANISLLHGLDGNQYVINLIDTPGHVDFTGKVTRALRAIDGAIVVVDAVEEIMAQTETVTRQALEERVRPVLFINKVDRLIKELKLTTEEIQKKFARIIDDFNTLIDTYGKPDFKNKWKIDAANETVAFGSALDKWGFTLGTAQQKQIRFTDVVDAYTTGKHDTLPRLLPVYTAILNMVVKNTPNPVQAQKYRLAKIWKGRIDSEIGQAMMNCSDEGPTVICVTNVQTDPKAGLVATGRILSGTIKQGDHVYLVTANKQYDVQQVSLYMGAFRETVPEITAGNIAAMLGLETARTDETVVDAAHKNVITPFEHTKHLSEPVITVAVEPKDPKDLPRIVEAMNRLFMEDPNLFTTLDKETGQCLMGGMGELHLEIAVKSLEELIGNVRLAVSDPIVTYRETVSRPSKIAMTKTPDRNAEFCVQAEPLDAKIMKLMEDGELSEGLKQKEIAHILQEKAGYSEGKAARLLAVDEHRNMLANSTQNVQISEEVMVSIVSGFHWACSHGPLCGEPMKGIHVKLVRIQLQEYSAQLDSRQVARAFGRAIIGAVLTAEPVLLEPIFKIEVSVPSSWFGMCSKIITSRRGKILDYEQKGALTVITAIIPVAESFGLSTEMRAATSGHAFWQCTIDRWEKTPDNVSREVTKRIRKRRGLPPQVPKPEKFIGES
jgi:elongation factor 2